MTSRGLDEISQQQFDERLLAIKNRMPASSQPADDERLSGQHPVLSRHVRGALAGPAGRCPEAVHIPTRYVGYFCGQCCQACREKPAAKE